MSNCSPAGAAVALGAAGGADGTAAGAVRGTVDDAVPARPAARDNLLASRAVLCNTP